MLLYFGNDGLRYASRSFNLDVLARQKYDIISQLKKVLGRINRLEIIDGLSPFGRV